MFTSAERTLATHIAALVYANPFLEARIEHERRIVGDAYIASQPYWSLLPDLQRKTNLDALDGWDASGLKALAAAAAAQEPAAAIALFSATPPRLAVVARGAQGGIDAAALLKSLVGRFGGRGGGKPDLAQGGGLTGDQAAILEAAKALLLG